MVSRSWQLCQGRWSVPVKAKTSTSPDLIYGKRIEHDEPFPFPGTLTALAKAATRCRMAGRKPNSAREWRVESFLVKPLQKELIARFKAGIRGW